MSSPSASVPSASPERPVSSIRTYSATGMVRLVGYGLLGMFLLDLPAVGILYLQSPLDPGVAGTVVAQILERMAVPLIAFALIFGWEVHDLPRWERILRKIMSHLMLVSSLACLAIGGLVISSGIRQYNRAATTADFRTNQRVSALNTLGKNLSSLTGAPLRAAYASVVRPDAARPMPSDAQMRTEIATALPGTIDGLYNNTRAGKNTGRRDGIISTGKYGLDALIAAVLFFVLWEASYSARGYRIFRQKNAPKLGVEGAVIDGLGNLGRKMEGIRILPDPEGWSWYRRLRRKWRHRKEKRRDR
jgi:hypothetical protein